MPDIDSVAHAHAAFLRFLGNNQAEMGAHNSLADATMGRDVIPGAQNREPGSLQIWHRLEQACSYRRLFAVFFQLVAEAEQNEGAPVGANGDLFLVGRNILKCRDGLPMLQNFFDLGVDRFPVFGEGGKERKMFRLSTGVSPTNDWRPRKFARLRVKERPQILTFLRRAFLKRWYRVRVEVSVMLVMGRSYIPCFV